jgi:putative spermidine/putrescine transport system substrate-binding protein
VKVDENEKEAQEMRKTVRLSFVFLLVLVVAVGSVVMAGAKVVTINLVTAGDQNMVDLFQNILGPEFTKHYPNIRVRVVGTGTGDAGSQKITEKLKAQKDAGKKAWDIDVAVIHEIGASFSVQNGLLEKYTSKAKTYKYVTSPTAKRALGVNVEGYVIPMFMSQTVIAYNPKYISQAPRSFDQLVAWVKKNPGKFGYNGLKNGASGVSFVASWLYWKTNNYKVLAEDGPYNRKHEADWDEVFAALKEFNKDVVITAGNAGTLDMLSRGEIWMGPVWVDMFYTWVADGRLNPNLRLALPAPGMCGQPMYYVIPAKATYSAQALKFIEYASSPKIQAKYIVEKFNWYPGIDGKYIKPYLAQATWDKVYKDISPEELNKYGRVFPIKPYYNDMMEAYEKAMK